MVGVTHRSTLTAVAIAGLVFTWTAPAPAASRRQDAADTLLASHVRALSEFLSAYLPAYAATVCTERYEQIERNVRRDLESEFAAVQLEGEWVGVRDVHRFNDRVIPDREGRVTRLFAMRERESRRRLVDRIAEESARFNLGGIVRSVNSPATVLALLDPTGLHGSRLAFSDGRYEPHGAGRMWTMRFVERTRPTLIRTPQGDDMPAEGRVWMDEHGLTRAETVIWLRNANGQETGRRGTVSIDLVDDTAIGLRVPARMDESYTGPTGFVVMRGQANYTNYRRFDVQSAEQLERIEGAR